VTPTSAAGSGSSRRARRAAALPSRLAPEIGPKGRRRTEDAPTPEALHEPNSGDELPPPTAPTFAHASEAEMARILDFYQVRWDYEPHTFPILWNLDGLVVESFSPDFWLPDLDLYLEMTTLRQKLVRKKNRKLRRVLELYPDLRVKLFYARDFRALMLKFGKLALIDEMSGTPGQVIPERIPNAVTGEAEAATGLAVPVVAPTTEPIVAPTLEP
jgi:hypoxanthine phosphoribosyltransferase